MTLDWIRRSVYAFQPPQFYTRLPRGHRLRGVLDFVRMAEKECPRVGIVGSHRACGAAMRVGLGPMKGNEEVAEDALGRREGPHWAVGGASAGAS